MEHELVSYQQFDSALRRIEKANLKKRKESLSWVSMSNHCNDLVLEIQDDNKLLKVVKDWRKKLKEKFLK